MDEKDILRDKSLEDLGLIKDIDTLSIIVEGQKIKASRQKKFINILSLIAAFATITVNLAMLFTVGLKLFLVAQVIMSWIITVPFLSILKKKYI